VTSYKVTIIAQSQLRRQGRQWERIWRKPAIDICPIFIMEKKHADRRGFHIMFNENLRARTIEYTIL